MLLQTQEYRCYETETIHCQQNVATLLYRLNYTLNNEFHFETFQKIEVLIWYVRYKLYPVKTKLFIWIPEYH